MPNGFPNGEAGVAVLLLAFEPKPPNVLFWVVALVLKSPLAVADVEALLLLNKPLVAGVFSLFFDAAPRMLKPVEAGAFATVFCEAPKTGVCDDCAPNVKPLAGAGAEAPKLVVAFPKFKSG